MKQNLRLLLIFSSFFIGFFLFLSLKNSVYAPAEITIFPKEKIQNPKIYYTTRYGYRDDQSWPIDLKNAFYIFKEFKLESLDLTASCEICSNITIRLPEGESVFDINRQYTEIEVGGEKIQLPSQSKPFRILSLLNDKKLSFYISTLSLHIDSRLVRPSINTTFPFFVYSEDHLSESTVDNDSYKPEFEREHNLGIKNDGSSIYMDDAVAKYKAADFSLKKVDRFSNLGIQLSLYNAMTSLFVTFVFLIIFVYRKKIILQGNGNSKKFTIFLFLYSFCVFIFFRNGVGDWATEWESMRVNVNQLSFSYLYSGLYQFLSYVFFLIGDNIRSLVCLFALVCIILFYKKILELQIKNSVLKYLLLGVVLFSPWVLIQTFHTQRYYFSSLFVVLGLMMTAVFFVMPQKRTGLGLAAFVTLMVASLIREDFFIYLTPLFFGLWFKNKGNKNAAVILGLVISCFGFLQLVANSEFKRSYRSTSYRNLFNPYYRKYVNEISLDDLTFLEKNRILTNFMPMLNEEDYQRFSTLTFNLIKKDPGLMIETNFHKLLEIISGQAFYRGLNTFGNNPYQEAQRLDLGNHTIETIANDFVSRWFHYSVTWLAEQCKKVPLHYLYVFLFVPVFFIRKCPFSGSLAFTFVLKLLVLFIAAPVSNHMYIEELTYWLHFSAAIFFVEFMQFRAIQARN